MTVTLVRPVNSDRIAFPLRVLKFCQELVKPVKTGNTIAEIHDDDDDDWCFTATFVHNVG